MPKRQRLKLIPVRKYFNSERLWKDHANWRNESLIWTRESKKTRWKLQKVYFQKLNKRQNHFFVIHYLLNPVGMCGLTKIDTKNGTAEFSLLVGSRYRGQGVGTKALVQLLRYGFNTLGLKLIFGETFSYKSTHGTNPGVRAYEKIGFTYEGTLRTRYIKFGIPVDALIYSITSDEFRKLWSRTT